MLVIFLSFVRAFCMASGWLVDVIGAHLAHECGLQTKVTKRNDRWQGIAKEICYPSQGYYIDVEFVYNFSVH